jgi:hypothetical protein
MFSSMLPISMALVQPKGEVKAIFATVPAPFTREPVRVRVLAVRYVTGHNNHARLIIDVVCPSAGDHLLPFSVDRSEVKHISVFMSWRDSND